MSRLHALEDSTNHLPRLNPANRISLLSAAGPADWTERERIASGVAS